MSYSTPEAVVLTVLFACTAVGYAVLGIRQRTDAPAGISDVLHVVMSLAMLSMPWSWGAKVASPTLQIIVFGLAALYFAVLLAGGDRFGGHTHHGTGLERQVMLGYHVVMMAAMVVMGLIMRDMPHSGSGMDMVGMTSDKPMPSTMTMHLATGWTVTSWVLVVVFVIATCALVVRWLRSAERHLRTTQFESTLLVLMSAGMALALVPTW